MTRKVPQGWSTPKLTELVSFVMGGDWGKSVDAFDSDYTRARVIRGTEFKNWREEKGTGAAERQIKISSLEKRRLRDGDLVLEVSGGGPNQPVGRSVLIDHAALANAGGPLICSNFFRLLRTHRGVLPKFISHFLDYSYSRGDFDDYQTQTTNLRNLNVTEFLKGTSVLLPPLNEQRRIVAKLEHLLEKVDTCQRRLAKIPVLLRRFRQSVLAAACSGRLTADWRERSAVVEDAQTLLKRMQNERSEHWIAANKGRKYVEPERLLEEKLPGTPAGWLWTNFDHCTWEITVGHVGPMKDRYVNSGVSFLRSQNVRPLRFDPAGLVYIPTDFDATLRKSRLLGGEILVTRSGANTGDCCVFPTGFGESNCADLVIIRPLSGLCADYAAIYVNSPTGQARLSSKETGIAQPHFNIGAMRRKAFPLPPFLEQQEIVRRVSGLLCVCDQAEARYINAKHHCERLRASILARAFRGELVPQDTNDEPASDLLERIQAERAVQSLSSARVGNAVSRTNTTRSK
jgi:type I restriction enzyme S subunit